MDYREAVDALAAASEGHSAVDSSDAEGTDSPCAGGSDA